MQIISKKEAKAKGLNRYYTGRPCVHGHFSERYLKGHCVACEQKRDAQYKQENRARVNASRRRSYIRNRTAELEYDKKRRQQEPEKLKAKDRNWYENNTERKLAQTKIWRVNNPEKVRANCSAYRARKLERTPKWLTPSHFAEIEDFYREAVMLSNETGVAHEVDHIVPLCGPNVSGLHVPWNLQVITATENRRKYNTLEEGTPCLQLEAQ